MNSSLTLTRRLVLAGLLIFLSACTSPKQSPAAQNTKSPAIGSARQVMELPLLLTVAPAQYQAPISLSMIPGYPKAESVEVQPAPAIAPANETATLLPPILPPFPAPPGESANPPPGFLLPEGLFDKPALQTGVADSQTEAKSDAPPFIITSAAAPIFKATPTTTQNADSITRSLVSTKLPPVYVYASPTTRNYLAAGGINYQNNIDIWQSFLRRKDVPFEVITNLDALKPSASGSNKLLPTLILPSAVALSETERRELRRFHDQGGALLATWLCGVRNEQGQWLGFEFMESLLDTKVTGTTQTENDDRYLMPYGDNPISHQLPAGFRVWTERIPEFYPLRLSSPNLAAQVMNWSRNVNPTKPSGLISFNQRTPAAGNARSVVLGYPERLWLAADPIAIDAVAGDALFWLMRQPAVYLATWPYPYRSAFLLAINASDVNNESDDAFAKQTESAGWHGTYYLLSENAEKAKPLFSKLQQRGHEVGYFGDRMVSFKNQPSNQQKKRLDLMQNEFQQAQFELTSGAGFTAPLEAYDDTTLSLLRARGVGHIITDPGASDARLPVLSPSPGTVSENGEQLVLLPRSMSTPEDLIHENKPAEAMKTFLAEIELADKMGSLGVVSVSTQTSLNSAQWGAVLSKLKEREKKIWLTTANQAASWWRERERVKVSLNTDVTPALLTVEVSEGAPLQQPVTLLVNLPQSGRTVRLTPDGHALPPPGVAPVDNLRSALILPKLNAGKYDWYLSFGPPSP